MGGTILQREHHGYVEPARKTIPLVFTLKWVRHTMTLSYCFAQQVSFTSLNFLWYAFSPQTPNQDILPPHLSKLFKLPPCPGYKWFSRRIHHVLVKKFGSQGIKQATLQDMIMNNKE
jgi:hypothetical protein